jgi:2-oxoglutarate-Fe(II)-dependent oxygenase superfamily protein
MPGCCERIGEILGQTGSPGCFTARRTATAEDLHLTVQGLGRLRLPISQSQAVKLCRLARPARYGRGEKTLLDRRVRDTWEIPKSRVKIDLRRWNRTLVPVLEALRADLGLAAGCRLKAELHSFLIYGPGQFFLPHKDSEKADAMVATLVVTLPAPFQGGALVVEHQGETVVHRSSHERLSFVAFYADCRHEVRPVQKGYRITLTYNLILAGGKSADAAGAAEPAVVESLAQCLREHFETPLPSRRWRDEGAPAEPPSRLVYLLDHEYTEHGLAWPRLKGDDAARAAALKAAAERCGCELVLALADVHETWSCMEPGWDEPWRGRHRSWRFDEDEDDEEPRDDAGDGDAGDADAYELGDFIDGEITLTHWIDQAGKKAMPLVSRVSGDEVCCSTPSSELRPYASEYEGYMGNYGNTMDRWYRRAALVVWPRERGFAVRAEASPAWALQTLERRIGTGGAGEAAASLLPFWEDVAYREDCDSLLGGTLRVADGLAAPELAASLLQPFRIEALTPEDAPALVSLTRRYGEGWARRLLSGWSGGPRRGRWLDESRERSWLAGLPRLCEALSGAGDAAGATVARLLLRDRWEALLRWIGEVRRPARPSQRDQAVAALSVPLLGILGAAGVIAADDLRDEVVAAVCADENEPLLPGLVQAVRTAAGEEASGSRAAPALEALMRHCIRRLEARLARPARGEGDWSIALPDGCRCELCRGLGAFLADPTRQRLEWPLAEQRRRHVHQRLEATELPVRHETRRSGRPYTLILSKTKELFEREARERQSWQSDLAWLRQRRPAGAGAGRRPRRGG